MFTSKFSDMYKVILSFLLFMVTFQLSSQTICKRVVTSFGNLPSSGYQVDGSAILTDSSGTLYLSLSSDFSTAAGPDLYLYLSINGEAPTVAGNTNVEVALMTSNTGAQSYTVPAGYNLTDFDYVLVHCKQFDSFWDGGFMGGQTCYSITGIEEEKATENLIITNNTYSENLKIELKSLENFDFTLNIYSVSGKLIKSSIEQTNRKLRVDHLSSSGIYFISVIYDNKRLTEKIIKK